MGFRFRRSARLGPLRFNFSKGGLSSISVGGRGASFNVPVNRRGGPRTTVGLPGTGLGVLGMTGLLADSGLLAAGAPQIVPPDPGRPLHLPPSRARDFSPSSPRPLGPRLEAPLAALRRATVVLMRCPTCKKTVADPAAEFRPFCSRRCKLIDLGNWLDGAYAVEGEDAPEEEVARALAERPSRDGSNRRDH